MRNFAWFLVGCFIVGVAAVAPEIARANTLTATEYQAGVAEITNTLWAIGVSLSLFLGVIAGRFR